jgi:hypothetical protein
MIAAGTHDGRYIVFDCKVYINLLLAEVEV